MTPNAPPQVDRNDLFARLHRRIVVALRPRFREQAEDIAQDAITLALEKYPEVKSEPDLFRLLFAIKKLLVLERLRPRRSDQMPETGCEYADGRPGPEQSLTDAERYDRLLAGIDQLKGRCKELIKLRLQEFETPRIAAILNITVNNVYQVEMRCIDRLRKIINPPALVERG